MEEAFGSDLSSPTAPNLNRLNFFSQRKKVRSILFYVEMKFRLFYVLKDIEIWKKIWYNNAKENLQLFTIALFIKQAKALAAI